MGDSRDFIHYTCNGIVGRFSLKVHDEELSIARSFAITPASRWRIVISYIVSGLVASFLLSVITLFVGEMYIWLTGGEFLPFESWIRLIGIILINVLCCSSIMFFIASLVKKRVPLVPFRRLLGLLLVLLPGFIYQLVHFRPRCKQR